MQALIYKLAGPGADIQDAWTKDASLKYISFFEDHERIDCESRGVGREEGVTLKV